MIWLENIVENLFDNMPFGVSEQFEHKREVFRDGEGPPVPRSIAEGVSGSEKATGAAQRNPQRTGGSRSA